MSYFDTVLFVAALMAWISMTDQNEMKIFGWQIFTSVTIIVSKDRRMEKLLGRFSYRWSTYPGSTSITRWKTFNPKTFLALPTTSRAFFIYTNLCQRITHTWIPGIPTLPPFAHARRRKVDFFLPRESRFLSTGSQVARYLLYWSRAKTTEMGKSVLN